MNTVAMVIALEEEGDDECNAQCAEVFSTIILVACFSVAVGFICGLYRSWRG
ncbi:hypothetical protein [Delftia phage PhiW-14]|uniref:Uncharacterized protein n=1 Tax=Delftia phage PhiW-14 TaxID=665032 RepID=C9DGA1_BPW14|nr:hypothetical protein DP-phiW-14_gp131 [Delftia phage PhiW-14]ACV50152.1 hypothetical protein [Delftia phage PhiW-14]